MPTDHTQKLIQDTYALVDIHTVVVNAPRSIDLEVFWPSGSPICLSRNPINTLIRQHRQYYRLYYDSMSNHCFSCIYQICFVACVLLLKSPVVSYPLRYPSISIE